MTAFEFEKGLDVMAQQMAVRHGGAQGGGGKPQDSRDSLQYRQQNAQDFWRKRQQEQQQYAHGAPRGQGNVGDDQHDRARGWGNRDAQHGGYGQGNGGGGQVEVLPYRSDRSPAKQQGGGGASKNCR